jgi:hypothetical protein
MVLPFLSPLNGFRLIAGLERAKEPSGERSSPDSDPLTTPSFETIAFACQEKFAVADGVSPAKSKPIAANTAASTV